MPDDESLFKAKLVDYVSDAIISFDLDFKILSWNKAAETLYGWKTEEAIGKISSEIIPFEFPYNNREEILKELFEEGFWKGEGIQYHRNGTRLNILSSSVIIKDDKGNSKIIVMINKDMSELKKAEQNLRESTAKLKNVTQKLEQKAEKRTKKIEKQKIFLFNIIESLTRPFYLINANDYTIEMANSHANFGEISEKSTCYALTHGYNKPCNENCPCPLEIVKKTKKSVVVDHNHYDKEGNVRNVEVHAYPILDINGNIVQMIEYIIDITERKKAESKLKESEEKYREAFKLISFYKDLFTHDMSNILTSIISSVDFYSMFRNDTNKLKKLGDIVEVVKAHAYRGVTLISNVRKLSTLDETKDVAELRSIGVFEILNKSVDNTISGFQGKNVKIDVSGLSKDMKVLGNELLIDIFDNILNNAVKFNDNKEQVKVEINITKKKENRTQYINFEFKDHGMGVPDENKGSIFEKSHRKDVSKRGMGLGLSLVKKIVDNYEGNIWIKDRIDGNYAEGSNFIVMLREA